MLEYSTAVGKNVETMHGYEISLIKQSKLRKLLMSISLFMLKNTKKNTDVFVLV